ncbi:hypothetical protein N3K66_008835 [Trichothecium roseum]|uniref:Uncharacterized protein n=1 Tax=Trichothecium roseum TaxID=47278 RepID=A0ACC0URP5_9HYPO|nr:hypothetical protein N3K66_008835 [Trichothecium roseum]
MTAQESNATPPSAQANNKPANPQANINSNSNGDTPAPHEKPRPAKAAARLRPARPSDAAAIAGLGADAFSQTFGHSVEPHELQAFLDAEYTPAAIARDLADPEKEVVVAVADTPSSSPDDAASATSGQGKGAEEAEEILGFAYLTLNSDDPAVSTFPSRAELQRIYVSPRAHGAGVGGALAREVDRLARARGFRHLWLGVWEENAVALRAYARWGYRVVGTHDFWVGPVCQRDSVMVKEL